VISGCLKKRREHILPGSFSGLQMASAVEHLKTHSYTLLAFLVWLCLIYGCYYEILRSFSRNLGYRDILCLTLDLDN